MGFKRTKFIALLVVWWSLAANAASAQDWPYWGGDQGGQRYSALNQINRDNVQDLELAWSYSTGELAEFPDRQMFASFHTTPLKLPMEAGGSLVFCTSYNRIVSLEPNSGAERWRFDPEIDIGRFPTRYNCRGIAYWKDTQAEDGGACQYRLFMGTTDLRLISIDAVTGDPCGGFGVNGDVDIEPLVKEHYRDLKYGDAAFSSPPVVMADTVVLGSSNNVRTYSAASPRGTVRGFDARTGTLKWTFDPIPYDPDDPEYDNWQDTGLRQTTGGNAWSMLSVDEERGLIFVPTGSASPDPYGGLRPGDNRYANSLVALDATTGDVVWHFQIIHHDVWDWDLPAQPILTDITQDGEVIPAVVQLTKQGLVFIFNRETGDPVFGVEERRVPIKGAVPGEYLSPTQPFPVKPAPLIEAGITPDDAWGLTFWDRGKCRETIENANYGPLFMPPTSKGTVTLPGMSVTNWGGGAFNAETNTLITTANRAPFYVRVFPAEEVSPEDLKGPPAFGKPRPIKGTPYAFQSKPVLSPIFMPCVAPPWGELLALDLSTGEIKWRRTLGTLDKLSPIPIALEWGTPLSGGPIVTAGGLIFIGATMDEKFRAFDIETGEELWKVETPTSSMAVPMTYEANGKQYVAIASGGHMWQYSQKLGDTLVVYALPD